MTELRLNHLNRLLSCFSLTDRVGSLFSGSPGREKTKGDANFAYDFKGTVYFTLMPML